MKKYQIIYADPPWLYDNGGTQKSRGMAKGSFPCMPIEDIKNLPIKDISDNDCMLFLWATMPKLREALEVIEAWGFKYKTSFVWDKIKHNMGHYNSVRHEFLLVCTRGSCTPDNPKLFDSVQSIERTKHSAKPEEFRQIIETLYPHWRCVRCSRRVDKFRLVL